MVLFCSELCIFLRQITNSFTSFFNDLSMNMCDFSGPAISYGNGGSGAYNHNTANSSVTPLVLPQMYPNGNASEYKLIYISLYFCLSAFFLFSFFLEKNLHTHTCIRRYKPNFDTSVMLSSRVVYHTLFFQ